MAATSSLQDIDDKFCICSICLEQLKEPKLLPCLHRYCKDCLRPIIRGSYDAIRCPECREEIQIPTNGVDGFKTDFYSKNLVEYVQIQQSLKSDEIRKCYSCSKHLKVAAYCFKCNGFLCKDCHKLHVTNNIVKDHQKHTLSLEDIEEKHIAIEKLASMRDAPRCNIHLEEIAKLYCETCRNLPICVACVHGEHKGHNLHEVKALAKLKRKQLTQILKALEETNEGKDLIGPRQAKEQLVWNARVEKENLKKMHHEQDQKIMAKIQDTEGRRQQVEQKKQTAEKKIFDSLQTEMEHEIQEVKKKYKDIFRVKKVELDDTFKARESSLEKELARLRDQRERFERDKKELLQKIEKQLNNNMKIIETRSQHFDNIKKRLETLNLMASSILTSDSDWSAVQCIPDMCTAATNLMEDLKKNFPELTTLTEVTVNYKQHFFGKPNFTKISDQVTKQTNIYYPYRNVCGITSSGKGSIVISGVTPDWDASFIIVIDIIGRILKEKKLNRGNYLPIRFCKFLSQHKVATVCYPNEIGLYDISDGSYVKKKISDAINSWMKDRDVRCVAADPSNNHILVGGPDRDVYVFDDQLNYLHIQTLPEMIKWPRDISVYDGHLLVCDYDGKKCYVTSTDELEGKLVGEFIKPYQGGNSLAPTSVCTDKNGFVYILLKEDHDGATCHERCCLIQYNCDGSQVLATRKLDGHAEFVTVVETSQGEKLVVATQDTHTLYLYDLITKD